MQKILESMRRVRALAAVDVDSRMALSLDADVELRPLAEALVRLREARPVDSAESPPGFDIDALWDRWNSANETLNDFSLRELRALCWDRRAAEDRRFLDALEASGYVPARLGFLRGLWHSHQHHWRLGTASLLETYFAAASAVPGHLPRWLESVNALPGVFSETAPRAVGDAFFKDLEGVAETFGRLRLSAEGLLAQRALRDCRGRWLDAIKKCAAQDHGKVKLLLRAGLNGVLNSQLTSKDDFLLVVERLLGMLNRSGVQYREAVAEWIVVDRRLGHPRRSSTSGNWVGVSEGARLAALRLFAAKDIGRFFDILIGRKFDTQQRRPFWEQYIDSPQFVDYSIACDPEDRKRLIAAWTDGKPDVARMNGAPDRHSAFIMRFRTTQYDLLVVEMSRSNNAMYLFNTEDFEERVGTIDGARFLFAALKDKAMAVDHWAHITGWEPRFRERLRRYGIHRGQR